MFKFFKPHIPSLFISMYWYPDETAFKAPNSKEVPTMFSGFQLPKIITARAKNPIPATLPLDSHPAEVKAKMNPPNPAKHPEIIVPKYLIFLTLIPNESAACGCSPHDLNLKPNFVLYRTKDKTTKMIIT